MLLGHLGQRSFPGDHEHGQPRDEQVKNPGEHEAAAQHEEDAQAGPGQPVGHLRPGQLREAPDAQPPQDDEEGGDTGHHFDGAADEGSQLAGPALDVFDVFLVFFPHPLGQATDGAAHQPQSHPGHRQQADDSDDGGQQSP